MECPEELAQHPVPYEISDPQQVLGVPEQRIHLFLGKPARRPAAFTLQSPVYLWPENKLQGVNTFIATWNQTEL